MHRSTNYTKKQESHNVTSVPTDSLQTDRLQQTDYNILKKFYLSTFLPFRRRPPFDRISSSMLIFACAGWWTEAACSWWWPTYLLARGFGTSSWWQKTTLRNIWFLSYSLTSLHSSHLFWIVLRLMSNMNNLGLAWEVHHTSCMTNFALARVLCCSNYSCT